jgi:hypothetical protein
MTAPDSLTIADLSDPASAVFACIELYGWEAPTAAANCALEAHFCGRMDDFRFWCAVFKELDEAKRKARH